MTAFVECGVCGLNPDGSPKRVYDRSLVEHNKIHHREKNGMKTEAQLYVALKELLSRPNSQLARTNALELVERLERAQISFINTREVQEALRFPDDF